MNEPMDILRHEHQIILTIVNGLDRLADRLSRGEEVDVDQLRSAIRFMREFADHCHHAKEEGILFPALTEKGVGDVHGPIAQLLQDHKLARDHVTTLNDAVSRYAQSHEAAHAGVVATAIRQIVKLYISHIWKEDNVLFPLAERLFSSEERAILYDLFEKAERDLGVEHEALAELARSFGDATAPIHHEHEAHA